MRNEKDHVFEQWQKFCNEEEQRRKNVNAEWQKEINSDNEDEDKKPAHI